MSFKPIVPCVLTVLALTSGGAALAADDPCAGFTWKVDHEHTLFSGSAERVTAGHDAAAAPAIRLDRLYDVSLAPVAGIRFAVRPSDKTLARAQQAGLLRLRIPAAGLYRISAADRSWVDVAAGGELLRVASFTGREGCAAPRKIVQFQLPAGEVVLQLSGGADHARIAVTRAPAD